MRQQWRDDAQLYYYEFTLGGGTVTFGFFGTEKQWDGKMEDHYQAGDEVKLIRKEYRCTGAEQYAHGLTMVDQARELMKPLNRKTKNDDQE